MLGGPVYIALIRFIISLAGVILLFSQMSEPRYGRRKTVICYGVFCAAAITLACIWYVVDRESCVKMVAFVLYLCFACVAVWMSSDSIFLSLYKLALTFYLMAVFLLGGIEASVLFFGRNVWADVIVRILLIAGMALFIERRVKDSVREFCHYVETELDRFSAAVMVISILFGIGFILNPYNKEQTPYRLFQILINFFLTGSLQFLIFRLYTHIGREKELQKQNQLMKMNQRLLERNMELLEESVQSGRKIRHDVRHHIAVIAEYARRGQDQDILEYLSEYKRETDEGVAEAICANTAVNNMLASYSRRAEEEKIRVTLDIELGQELSISNIDLVTILANAYENAIFGCMEARRKRQAEECFIHLLIRRKKNKLVISCSNTCSPDTEFRNGQPRPEDTGGIGVLSIIRTAEKYDGEYDFKVDDGVFVFRLIMNIPS